MTVCRKQEHFPEIESSHKNKYNAHKPQCQGNHGQDSISKYIFLCNTSHFIVCIYKHYFDIGFIGFTRQPKESVLSS